MTETNDRDPLADLYAVATALAELADCLDETDGGKSCMLRLLGQEVQHCTERLDTTTR